MGKFENLTGRRFGRLTVIEKSDKRTKNGLILWKCKCDCGNIRYIPTSRLKQGFSTSCGCYSRELQRQLHTKHGMSKTRLFNIWLSIKNRCFDTNNNRYYRYGGRGITVISEWLKFENFRDWALKSGYDDTKSIDRIDNDGNYCPQNCRWATPKQQARNRSSNKVIYGKSLSEWCELLNVDYDIIEQRMSKYGMTLKEALETPVRRYKDRPEYTMISDFNPDNYT